MEGDAAVQALHSAELEKYRQKGEPVPPELTEAIERTRADYERWLDARYAAARGHVDAVIDPNETREILTLVLQIVLQRPRAGHLVLETL